MLRATFQRLIRGIDSRREAALWRQGVLSWDDFESRQPVQGSLFPVHPSATSPLAIPRAALDEGNIAFFASALKRREHFRIPLQVPERTIFLDIETTGLSRHYDIVTLVGWCYRGRYGAHVRGQDEAELRAALQDAQVIVTFNGSLFDLPFLRIGFSDIPIPPVHIDLRFLAKRVGLSGGQKAIEEDLGFARTGAARDVRGEAAPILWHRYRRGDLDALRLLIEYNYFDIEGMKYIFDKTIAKLLTKERVPKTIRERIPSFAKPSKLLLADEKANAARETGAICLSPYRGPVGPAILLSDLVPDTRSGAIRIVGIDLTGSPARLTGWCLLDGRSAYTRCLSTDKELISATLNARPHLISIDSPLSLPRGRTSVSDDDPGRKEFGIMRHCERVLKKRGINVYPALIQSMQKLTARGIALASALRSCGVPVIESYPGAAQDIMGIPRKRASLEMLRDGLNEFGVCGEFLDRRVTHDELDAITAAIVGAFFWGGRFEALGDNDEEALVIPDLGRSPQPWLSRQVIGLSGRPGAGKTTAARYLEQSGFIYGRYSMVIEQLLAREKGEAPTRTELQAHGLEIHRRYGQRWLGRRLLESLPDRGNLVIDGLRFPDDHAFLAESFGPAFLHVHLSAPDDLRNLRFAARASDGRSLNLVEAHPVEGGIQLLGELAHVEIANDAALPSFQARIASLIRDNNGG